ncbi:MAG: hypothetical protein Q9218_007894 [Villophora microphyllina]
MDLQGRPFDGSSSVYSYWQRFMIFVLKSMSENAAVGPSDRGAAMIMGHSVKQWHDWYDLKFHSRLAQNAQTTSAPRRRAQIVYTDSESDEAVQQPASAAASSVKLNPAAESAAEKVSATAMISDSDSDIELWV